MRTIRIEREPDLDDDRLPVHRRGFSPNLYLFIDGERAAEIRAGETLELAIPDDAQELVAGWGGRRTKPFKLKFVEDGEKLILTPWCEAPSGWFTLPWCIEFA